MYEKLISHELLDIRMSLHSLVSYSNGILSSCSCNRQLRWLTLGTLSLLLDSFVGWLPKVIIAIVVLLFGLAVANYVEMKTVQFSQRRGIKASGAILKWVIVVMVLILALRQIGVEVGLLENTFLLIIGSLAIGLALALGIGLGLGLRKESEGFVKNLKKYF